MNQPDIRTRLDRHLLLLAPQIPIAFQDVQFTPPAEGAPFLRTTLIPAPPITPTLDEQVVVQRGIYQIMLSYPTGNGPRAAETKAAAIQTHFPALLALGDGLRTRGKPTISPPIADEARTLLAVSVRYEVVE